MAKQSTISLERLERLEPISLLAPERLEELAKLAYVESVGIGVCLFREGDVDNQTLYLLKGDVQLVSSDGKIDRMVSHRHAAAKFPLDDSQPRQVSCRALGLVRFLRIDNSILDYMMTWDQLAVQEELLNESRSNPQPEPQPEPAVIETQQIPVPQTATRQTTDQETGGQSTPAEKVQETSPEETISADTCIATTVDTVQAKAKSEQAAPQEEKGAWMRRMRHIMAFKNLPPANIKPLLNRMEALQVQEGETVVEQGSSGDYYYVLTEGDARVIRTIELATLKAGSSFGEESLVSGVERNASVIMSTPGIIMRLSKQDFDELLKEPMLNRFSPDEARLREAKGATWLDIRHASEFHHTHLPRAINLPLHELRMRMDELDKKKHYICYCNTGRRSSAATFILVQNGYHASVLNGGVQTMPQDLQRG